MKMYTNSEQTTKLIELGFDKPKGWCAEGISSRLIMYKHKEDDEGFNYSIGELIELLPKEITNVGLTDSLSIYTDHNKMWTVEYSNVLGELLSAYRTELIDALYDMFVRLKEEGVI